MNLVLDDTELIELYRILLDDDAPAALDFLKAHFKGQIRKMLDGG